VFVQNYANQNKNKDQVVATNISFASKIIRIHSKWMQRNNECTRCTYDIRDQTSYIIYAINISLIEP